MDVTYDGEENRALAVSLIGEAGWERLQVAKRATRVDPSLAIVALKARLAELEGR
jgi:hypothetical protein